MHTRGFRLCKLQIRNDTHMVYSLGRRLLLLVVAVAVAAAAVLVVGQAVFV